MLVAAYQRVLHAAPLPTKCCTTAVLFSAGDAFAHSSVLEDARASPATTARTPRQGRDEALRRNLAFSSYGGLFGAPTQHYFFGFMERNVAVGLAASPGLQAFTRSRFTAPRTVSRWVVATLDRSLRNVRKIPMLELCQSSMPRAL